MNELCTLPAADLVLALPTSGSVEAHYGPIGSNQYALILGDTLNLVNPSRRVSLDGTVDAAQWRRALPTVGNVTVYEQNGALTLTESRQNAPEARLSAQTVTLPKTARIDAPEACSAPNPHVPAAPQTKAQVAQPEPDVLMLLHRYLTAAQHDVIRYSPRCYELWLPGKQRKVFIFCGVGYTLVTLMTVEGVETQRYRELTTDEVKTLFESKVPKGK